MMVVDEDRNGVASYLTITGRDCNCSPRYCVPFLYMHTAASDIFAIRYGDGVWPHFQLRYMAACHEERDLYGYMEQ